MNWNLPKKESGKNIRLLGGIVTSEYRRPRAIEKAIISPLAPEDGKKALEEGLIEDEWLIQRRLTTKSIEKLWSPLTE